MPHGAYFLSAALLVLLLSVAAAARDTAFHGYSEKSTPPGPSTSSPAPCRDHHSACADWASKGECQKNPGFMNEKCPLSCKVCKPDKISPDKYRHHLLVFKTDKGDIKIRPAWDTAPHTAALIMDLAAQAEDQKTACRFYRNEAVPPAGSDGPPYGLLQGSLTGLLEAPTQESRAPPVRGAAAMIAGTDFYISLMGHSSWGSAHTVWGHVEPASMQVVDAIVNSSPYKNFTHPSFGTVMRMMVQDLRFTPVLLPPDLGLITDSTAEL